MYEKLKDIFTLLPLGLILLFALNFMSQGKINKSLALSIPENIGIDNELKEKVDSLELDISRRQSYEVEINRDPLKLNAILRLKGLNKAKEFKERRQALRLSCTILSPKSKKAVVKYRSKSYVLAEGDKISGYRVKRIEKKRVILTKAGKQTILVNKPAPKREQIQDKSRTDKDIKL